MREQLVYIHCNITFNILDGSVYIQSLQLDVLAEIRALKRDVYTLNNNHKVLQNTVQKGQFEIVNSSFKVDNTITQTLCQYIQCYIYITKFNVECTEVAKAFCKSLTRKVGEATINVDTNTSCTW